jgi:methylase of polypeptide subunit release factors
MEGVKPERQFDVIVTNPPYFPGEPLDLADRAWHAGPNYRDIAQLFAQAQERLKPNGSLYVMVSSASDVDHLSELVSRANLRWWPAKEFSIIIEKLVIYEARIHATSGRCNDIKPPTPKHVAHKASKGSNVHIPNVRGRGCPSGSDPR